MAPDPDTRPVRLRGHHLACLRTYRGGGYPAEFAENLIDALTRAAEFGIEIIEGPDEVCAACPHLREGACLRDEPPACEITALDVMALGMLGLAAGDLVDSPALAARVDRIWAEWLQNACSGCEYAVHCRAETA